MHVVVFAKWRNADASRRLTPTACRLSPRQRVMLDAAALKDTAVMSTNRFHEYMAGRKPPPPNPMAEAAIALGLPCFPCGADKRPLTAHGFKDASSDAAVIRAAFSNPAAVMIGVPTGTVTGWAVVDIDTKDGARGQEWLDANADRLPSTRTHATRSGGWHLIFKMPEVELRNSASKIAPGVDVRANGGYVIVPPSTGYHLIPDGPEPAEMPDWVLRAAMPEPKQERPAVVAAVRPVARVQDGNGSHYGLAALEDECQAIRTAPDGQKHATINKAAYAIGGLVTAGELQEGQAFAELSNALGSILPYCKDKRAAERTLRNSFQEGMGRPRDIPAMPEPPPEEVHPAAGLIAKLSAKAAKRSAQPLPIPIGMMDVGGALGMFVEHCERTAISPQPILSLAAGICLIGVLAGRRYRTDTNLRTNIYSVGVADSGAGKDHARKMIRECLAAAGLTQYLGGEKIASGQSMLTALTRHPASLFQIDEFGDFLADVLGQKASAHRRDIAANLKTLYSSASSFMLGTEYADDKTKPRADIQQPHACMYATTTPGQLWAAIEGKSMHDGLMARVLLFVSPCSYPDEADPSYDPPPPKLIAALKAIASGGSLGTAAGNLPAPHIAAMSSTIEAKPALAPNTPGALAAYKAVKLEQLDRQRKNEGTYVTAIVGRFAENTMKLALVRAVSRNPMMPKIEEDDVVWGRLVAKHCIDTLLREASTNIAETEYEAKLNKVLDIIRKHGPITEYAMGKKGLRKFEPRERRDILRALVNDGEVREEASEVGIGQGRPTIRYSINPSSISYDGTGE